MLAEVGDISRDQSDGAPLFSDFPRTAVNGPPVRPRSIFPNCAPSPPETAAGHLPPPLGALWESGG